MILLKSRPSSALLLASVATVAAAVGIWHYFRRIAGNQAKTRSAVAQESLKGPKNKPILIIYGTTSGNAEAIANSLKADIASRIGAANVELLDPSAFQGKGNSLGLLILRDHEDAAEALSQFYEGLFFQRAVVIIIAATTGAGAMPRNLVDLMAVLERAGKELSSGGGKASALAGLPFAVLALGNRAYEQYCRAGLDCHRVMAQLGAAPLLPVVCVDEKGVDQDTLDSKGEECSLVPISAVRGSPETVVAWWTRLLLHRLTAGGPSEKARDHKAVKAKLIHIIGAAIEGRDVDEDGAGELFSVPSSLSDEWERKYSLAALPLSPAPPPPPGCWPVLIDNKIRLQPTVPIYRLMMSIVKRNQPLKAQEPDSGGGHGNPWYDRALLKELLAEIYKLKRRAYHGNGDEICTPCLYPPPPSMAAPTMHRPARAICQQRHSIYHVLNRKDEAKDYNAHGQANTLYSITLCMSRGNESTASSNLKAKPSVVTHEAGDHVGVYSMNNSAWIFALLALVLPRHQRLLQRSDGKQEGTAGSAMAVDGRPYENVVREWFEHHGDDKDLIESNGAASIPMDYAALFFTPEGCVLLSHYFSFQLYQTVVRRNRASAESLLPAPPAVVLSVPVEECEGNDAVRLHPDSKSYRMYVVPSLSDCMHYYQLHGRPTRSALLGLLSCCHSKGTGIALDDAIQSAVLQLIAGVKVERIVTLKDRDSGSSSSKVPLSDVVTSPYLSVLLHLQLLQSLIYQECPELEWRDNTITNNGTSKKGGGVGSLYLADYRELLFIFDSYSPGDHRLEERLCYFDARYPLLPTEASNSSAGDQSDPVYVALGRLKALLALSQTWPLRLEHVLAALPNVVVPLSLLLAKSTSILPRQRPRYYSIGTLLEGDPHRDAAIHIAVRAIHGGLASRYLCYGLLAPTCTSFPERREEDNGLMSLLSQHLSPQSNKYCYIFTKPTLFRLPKSLLTLCGNNESNSQRITAILNNIVNRGIAVASANDETPPDSKHIKLISIAVSGFQEACAEAIGVHIYVRYIRRQLRQLYSLLPVLMLIGPGTGAAVLIALAQRRKLLLLMEIEKVLSRLLVRRRIGAVKSPVHILNKGKKVQGTLSDNSVDGTGSEEILYHIMLIAKSLPPPTFLLSGCCRFNHDCLVRGLLLLSDDRARGDNDRDGSFVRCPQARRVDSITECIRTPLVMALSREAVPSAGTGEAEAGVDPLLGHQPLWWFGGGCTRQVEGAVGCDDKGTSRYDTRHCYVQDLLLGGKSAVLRHTLLKALYAYRDVQGASGRGVVALCGGADMARGCVEALRQMLLAGARAIGGDNDPFESASSGDSDTEEHAYLPRYTAALPPLPPQLADRIIDQAKKEGRILMDVW